METIEALRAIDRGEKPDQETILRLHEEGLIEITPVTHFRSRGQEFLPTMLTAKGLRLLEKGEDSERPTREKLIEETKPAGLAEKRWDVFISHASEDKQEIAHSLAEALQKRGFAVWYDKFSLKLGDSLRESIDRGLAESRFGVVTLSKHFFAKRWPNKELNGLTAIEVNGERVILPVWHGITHDEVLKFSPTLADRKAVRTEEGLDAVVEAIAAVVDSPLAEDLREQLQAAEETLQEYRCPFCGAPLSARSSVDLSEDDSGLYENFECGYAHIDGYMEHPCPLDPKFPKLTDYKFIDKEVEGDSYWRWQCVAIGNTKEAQKLMLLPGLGRTKEEARASVEESYRNYAKPWKK